MKIGVISDTHLLEVSKEFIDIFDQYFNDMDLILHAGDIVGEEVLDFMQKRGVLAVSGNMDVGNVPKRLPKKRIIEAENFKIGLIHGWGAPHGLEDKLIKEFSRVNCIVYGHSHRPKNIHKDGILFFNPGTTSYWARDGRRTIGILEIDKNEIKGTIVPI